jgi:hypothetical protein
MAELARDKHSSLLVPVLSYKVVRMTPDDYLKNDDCNLTLSKNLSIFTLD